MKRLERLTSILVLLQSNKFTKAEQIKQKFNTSIRTVYRDIRALIEAGTPIGYEANLGYFINDRHFLKPIHLSESESKSLLFAEQLMKKYTDIVTYQEFKDVLEKIRTNLNDTQLETVEALAKKIGAYVGPNNSEYTRFLKEAEYACSNKQILSIDYENRKEEKSLRDIEPIALTFYGQSWHIIAYCHLRKSYRDFSIARIKKLLVVGTHQTNHISLTDYIQHLENNNQYN